MLTNRHTNPSLFSVEDLQAGGGKKRIAVQYPTGGTNVPRQFIESNFPTVDVIQANGFVDVADKVKDGQAQAGVYDEPVLQWLAAKDEARRSCSDLPLEVTGDLFGPQEYAYAFPKNSPLRDAVSEAVTYLRSRKHPDIDHELSKKWFPGFAAGASSEAGRDDACATADIGDENQLTFHDFSQIFLVVSAAVGVVVALWAAQAVAFACVNSRRRGR
ncbi:unnamed protein product [Amoebophrya sp. A120]|nr:unnamed protein product [Amoebophrya sp. A120]|eukprot:GSA120T00018477001.1